jgi:sec-independent protein translocase protein TatA
MGSLSIWHILILTLIALLLFGGSGKISDLMSDVAKGVRSFRAGLTDSEDAHQPRALPSDRSADHTPSME